MWELSPFLAKLKEEGKPEGFDAPPRYFRELPDEVLERLRREKAGAAGWRARLGMWLVRPRLAAALAGAGAIAAVLFLFFRPAPQITAVTPPALSAEEIHHYIRANLVDFDEELVIEAAGAGAVLDALPSPGSTEEEQLFDEYYEELIRDIDVENIEEIL